MHDMVAAKMNHRLMIGMALYLLMVPYCFGEKLDMVVQQVAATNPMVLTQAARRNMQSSQLREAISGYMPRIDVIASWGRDHNKNYFTRLENPVSEDMTLTARSAGLSIRQMLFDGFKVRSEVEVDSARVEGSSFAVLATLEEVVMQVTAAYIDTIMHRSIFMHAKDNVAYHQQLVDQLLQDGGLQSGDIQLAKSRLSLAQTVALDVQKNIRDSQAAYIKVVGAKPGVMYRPEDPDKALPINEEAAVAIAMKNNPLVALGNSMIKEARAEKKLAKSAYFPKFDLELTGTNNNNLDGINQTSNSLSAMLWLRYNVFHGGQDVANEQKAGWMIEEKKAALNEELRAIEHNMRVVWSAYSNFKGQLVYLKQRVDTLEQTRDAYRKEFFNGNRELYELLDAQAELYLAKSNYVAAQYQELLSKFMILHGAGKIKDYFRIATPATAKYSPCNWINGF